ncbi:MAG: hypothetical protein ACRC6Z_07290 [Cetobacterium sp.]
MKIKPIGNRVLVEIINLESTTSNGIILIQNNDEKNYRVGNIIATSDEYSITSKFSINTKVIFSKKSGIIINHSSKEKMLLELDEILGIVEE